MCHDLLGEFISKDLHYHQMSLEQMHISLNPPSHTYYNMVW